MNLDEIKKRFAIPLEFPSYPTGPYHFRDREYLIISYRTDFPEDKWDLLIGVMLTGTFLCTKYTLPYLL